MSAYEDYMTHKATTFGMKSVIYVPQIKSDTVAALSAFCDKATMGVLVAPTLSIGSILLQQAAISASFHYRNVEIVESKDNANDLPSAYANHIANNLFKLGEIYNREEDSSTDVLVLHSLELLQTMPPKKFKKKNISTQHEEVTQPLNFDL
ncbi:dihydrodipicolinate reductase-like protein CRR1, chloroplastic [Vicia villosa]|uniref:dihydrodipicolinate reductase-like protein CRR1, chloroplastic n=1 Tax=Vicia villosa TaxID=3911 RepID=UPI00273BB3F4|nr:dihydrodipicolinate reductase-like protein CRR1, chloroplastic [Vicia villosa]